MGKKISKVPFFSSMRVKYMASYLVIFAVVLILMNTYPVLASQQLLFTSKRDALKSRAAVISSALIELETLSPEPVARVMNMLDGMGLARVLVTDPAGLVLYDSLALSDADAAPAQEGQVRYALLQEVISALKERDIFFSRYENKAFVSTAATPIVHRGMVIGAVYILEIDNAQGILLYNLQQNLRTISLVIAAAAVTMSVLFSKVLSARIAALLGAIRIVGQGEYGARLQPAGKDEMAQLAQEFNLLTDRLQTLEQVRRHFVSDASHELKTPLASIRLLADSILQNEQMDAATARDFVRDIGSEAERLSRITEHLLTLTRLDSLPASRTERVDVWVVLEKVVNRLSAVAGAAQVSVELSGRAGYDILCNKDDLYQICYNLIENAIKYNLPNGTVSLRVFREREQVLFEICDTGIGIPEDELPKIFNRFYRVDKARSRAAGGTGLGLSIVRDAVRRHGGWITARGRNPQGSIFTVGFPQYQQQEGQE